MRQQSLMTWAVGVSIAAAASVALFSSCGGDSDDGDSSGSVETTITDGAQPVTVAVGQMSMTIEGGAFETGTVVTLATADVPGEFSALADMPAASSAFSIAANKDNVDLTEAKAPLTLAITLNAAAGLVDPTADNLCIFVKTSSKKGVWRNSGITLDEAKTIVTIKSALMGTYMAAYCGDAAIEGFEDQAGAPADGDDGDGDDAAADEPTDFPIACYQTPYKYCQFIRQADETAANVIAHCKGGDQQGQVMKQCPQTDFVSSCDGEKMKSYWYEGHASPATECFDGETFSETYSEG